MTVLKVTYFLNKVDTDLLNCRHEQINVRRAFAAVYILLSLRPELEINHRDVNTYMTLCELKSQLN